MRCSPPCVVGLKPLGDLDLHLIPQIFILSPAWTEQKCWRKSFRKRLYATSRRTFCRIKDVAIASNTLMQCNQFPEPTSSSLKLNDSAFGLPLYRAVSAMSLCIIAN